MVNTYIINIEIPATGPIEVNGVLAPLRQVQSNLPIDWRHSPEQMVEATLQANVARLAGKYRGTDVAAVAKALLPLLRPLLDNLNPVTTQQSFELAQHAIDRALVAIDVFSENELTQLTSMARLTGARIRQLMRINALSIRQISERMSITMKRVREVRENGVTGNCYCRDWYEAITKSGIYLAK